MAYSGVGSLSSPIIVISDDEDEAFVEFTLEQRISSPTENLDYDDLEGLYDFSHTEQDHAIIGQNQSLSRNPSSVAPPNSAHGTFLFLV